MVWNSALNAAVIQITQVRRSSILWAGCLEASRSDAVAVLPSRSTVQSHPIGRLVSVLSGVHWIPRIGVRFFLPWESRSEKKTACGSWSVGDMLLSSVQCWASAGERCSRAFSVLQQAITRRLDLGLRDLQRRYRFDGGMFRDICWD